MKRSLGEEPATRKLTCRVGDRDVPVKSDSDDSDDEFDDNWNIILMSKETFNKRQAAAFQSGLENEGRIQMQNEVTPRVNQVQPSVIKVTGYNPVIDKMANRERSIRALDATRDQISEKTGRPHRLVIDPLTGMLLSRDTVDTRLYEEEESNTDSNNFHYQSSVRALERLRDLRLIRKLDDALAD